MPVIQFAHARDKGRPFGLFETSGCCKILKTLKGGLFGDQKIRKKVPSAEK